MDRPRRARSSSVAKSPDTSEMYHRPHHPHIRNNSSLTNLDAIAASPTPSPRTSPLLPPSSTVYLNNMPLSTYKPPALSRQTSSSSTPTICGLPLKYVALVTLAVQNAALSIVMHYSRVSTPPSKSYSPALAVLLNELLKGSISLVIAFFRIVKESRKAEKPLTAPSTNPFVTLFSEVFGKDCWKLSIPAILYVIQNSLQFVAISNLPVASFQVIYQMKILTTAAFSVALLGKKLSPVKWLALLFLAIGVGIVQIQTTSSTSTPSVPKAVGSAQESAPRHVHTMSPLKGFGAVTMACFTSGLAGVYFERELKNSKADLWVRNLQLSLFSLIPAILPVLWTPSRPDSQGFMADLFRHFGSWAWGTVFIQVFGGLITAIVIKYSDNIMKGFATSLAIILSSLASVILFNFRLTPSFMIGSSTVLAATWMYNQPAGKESNFSIVVNGSPLSSKPPSPILGHFPTSRKSSPFGTPKVLASALGLDGAEHNDFSDMLDTSRYQYSPYGSPYPSRPPSRIPSRVPSRSSTPAIPDTTTA